MLDHPSVLKKICSDKETPLHKAALYGSLPVVKTLVEAKVDVNAKAK